MPKIASTAKPATSRTRRRISTGSHPKAAEVRITRTCSRFGGFTIAIAAALSASAADARLTAPSESARTYVRARLAAIEGDHSSAAELLAGLSGNGPDQSEVTRRALGEALGAGRLDLASSLARKLPSEKLASDARLLLMAEELRRHRPDRAVQWLAVKGDNGDLMFFQPLVAAWTALGRGNVDQAQAVLAQIPLGSLLTPYKSELQAEILLKARRTAEAEPFARRAVGAAGVREDRLRLAFADGFLAAGDKARAAMIVEGIGTSGTAARRRILAGKASGQAIDTLAKSMAEVLTSFSADVARLQHAAPLGLVQVAHYLDPANSSSVALLALLLNGQDRNDEALAVLRRVGTDDALSSQVRDLEVQILTGEKRNQDAYRIAAAALARPDATAADHSRIGNALAALGRHSEAADSYGRAIGLAKAEGATAELWTLDLLQASELEEANRWPEAKAALQAGLTLAPDQPLLLNFLGYAKLERSEDVDSAMAMIRKASELSPDDASIIDSLGWAEFKQGKVENSIMTLQRAAAKDPEQAEIQEHLGDALYSSGRRYEARFAWNAALLTAKDEVVTRLTAKITSGLSPTNAAP